MKQGGGAAGWRRFVRWLKFNAVGAIGIAVQLGALAVFTSGTHLNYLAATALAVELAILHNFCWHERFTWADRTRHASGKVAVRFLKFNFTTGLFSIAGNLLLMRVFVGSLGLNYLVANIATIATCSIVNFIVSDQLVFGANARLGSPRAE